MLFTIGHSTHLIERFLDLLLSQRVERLVDVRRVPHSRRHPQFNRPALAASLGERGIAYFHAEAMGGMREAGPDSPDTAWREAAFQAYAGHMRSAEFLACLDGVVRAAEESTTALMCAEANPLECHRQLIADALAVRGKQVRHILSDGRLRDHVLTEFARVEGKAITYPGLFGAGR